MTKERIVKELSKVREQLAGLQARERDLAEQLQMAEDNLILLYLAFIIFTHYNILLGIKLLLSDSLRICDILGWMFALQIPCWRHYRYILTAPNGFYAGY